MNQATLSTSSPVQRTRSGRLVANPSIALECAIVVVLFSVAVALRLPYLHEVPRYTDELQEIIWSLSIARGEILPLTAVDSYYGPLWSYLLAGLFVLFGPSPELPRLAALALGAGMVVLTYGFARDVVGPWPATIAAGLLATSGGHIIINSHTARSNNVTPILTTAAIWLIYRALATRRWDAAAGSLLERAPNPRLLLPAGLLLGLALQTHLSVVALLPGLAAYGLWQGRHLLRTPWPYLAALGVALGYANMLAFNFANGFSSFRHARSLQEGYTGGRSTDLEYYLANLAALVQSLSRLLSGTIDTADSPARFVYVAVALVGLVLLTRRVGPLIALAVASIVLVLPYFNPRYGPILSGRYLIPLLPLCYLGIGCAVVVAARALTRRPTGRRLTGWAPLAVLAGSIAILWPLLPLRSYYDEVLADSRTNASLHAIVAVIMAARTPGEIVLLDEGLAQEQLGAGGTDLKAYRMLLGTLGIPYQVAKVSEADLSLLGGQPSALFLMEAKKRSSLPRELRATSIGRELESASGSEHRYAVFRLTPR